MRILFLIFLILAFAQPFFKQTQKNSTEATLQVIYIDNSASMSLKQGARTLLDIAKEEAKKQLQQAPQNDKFLLLTNDKPIFYQPVSAEKAQTALGNIELSSSSKDAVQTFNLIQGLMQSEALSSAKVYYYSDFQKNTFPNVPDEKVLANIDFYGIPIRNKTPSDIYIDTAVLNAPVLHSGQANQLIVTSRYTGDAPKETPILQLIVNDQVKTAATIYFNDKKESIDTLSFQANDQGWQRMALVINDAVTFDDTFRIAARSNHNLSVLVLNERQPNPFIHAAFRAYQGFRMDNKSLSEMVDWKLYNLIILNGVTQLTDALAKHISDAQQQGQSVVIFPGKINDISALNSGLVQIAGIELTGIDTVSQTATGLQQGSDLVKDIFVKVPDNIQLPLANWHYKIKASLSANEQAVISFRNGDPLLAQYTPSKGKLYMLSTTADLQGGNFAGSYFFAPFLYQMALQSKTGNVFAATIGTGQPVYISFQNDRERNMVHLKGNDKDIIPPQRANGAGLDIFPGNVLQQAGFYTLTSPGNDTVQIAMNEDRRESQLELWDMNTLQKQWRGKHIGWAEVNQKNAFTDTAARSFALWKVCVILAVIMLAAETYLLASGYRKTSIVTP